MMKKLIFSIIFLVFYIFLSNGLSIVNAQENIQEDEYSKTTTTNLTQICGEPIYKEISRQ